jgi:hypothetical protein
MLKNGYYEEFLKREKMDKDSIFEPCTILDYDKERMTAKVVGEISKQMRSSVPVLFPSMFLGSGTISPPAKHSTGLLFWGASRTCYLMPAQFFPLTQKREEDEIKLDSSPTLADPFAYYRHVNGGEHFIRSLGGAYFHVTNNDQIILSTSEQDTLQLSKEGFFLLSESEQKHINGIDTYTGSIGDGDTHMKVDVFNPLLDSFSLDVEEAANISLSQLTKHSPPASYAKLSIQIGSVYKTVEDESTKQNSNVDNSPLLFDMDFFSDQIKTFNMNISEKGAFLTVAEDEQYSTQLIIKPGGIQFRFINKQTGDEEIQNFGFGW